VKAQFEQLSTDEGNEKTSAHVPHDKSFLLSQRGEWAGRTKNKDVFDSVCTVPATSYGQSTFVEAY